MEEMEFLGMQRPPKTESEKLAENDPIQIMEGTQETRRQYREQIMAEFEADRKVMEEEIRAVEEADIID